MMRIGELCAGYGGLGMGVQSVIDARMAWCADNDLGASKILAHHWPTVPNHGDLTTTDWATVEPVDIITAGWPCQPWSLAGKGRGKDDERSHLAGHRGRRSSPTTPLRHLGERRSRRCSRGACPSSR